MIKSMQLQAAADSSAPADVSLLGNGVQVFSTVRSRWELSWSISSDVS